MCVEGLEGEAMGGADSFRTGRAVTEVRLSVVGRRVSWRVEAAPILWAGPWGLHGLGAQASLAPGPSLQTLSWALDGRGFAAALGCPCCQGQEIG